MKVKRFNEINESKEDLYWNTIVNEIEKDPDEFEKQYELQLGREGKLGKYLEKHGKEFTFGLLKVIFHDSVEYKRKRELLKGGYKMIHRLVPMTLAFFFFPIWLVGNILGVSRAFNKVFKPIVKDPGHNYNSFLVKLVDGIFNVAEGEIKYIMGKDWFYNTLVMKDDLVKFVRKDITVKFGVYLADKMEKEPDDKIVPKNYIENEFKKYLNKNFKIDPPLQLKD